MLFVQYLFCSYNISFHSRAALLENIDKVRRDTNEGEQLKDERITEVGDKWALNQPALNTALLEDCRGNGRSICYCDQ